jgi:hypothetical protein
MATSSSKIGKPSSALRHAGGKPNHSDQLIFQSSWAAEGYSGEDSLPPTIFIKPLSSRQGGLGFYEDAPKRTEVPVQPIIDWTEDARELGSLVLKHQNILDAVRYPELRPHVELMYDRMVHHSTVYEGDFYPPWYMVGRSLSQGPEFTAWWASELKQARFEWLGMDFHTKPEKPSSIKLTSYDSSYLPYFFIFWREEVEDYKAMFDGVPSDTDPEVLETISDLVAEMSEKLISDEEIASDPPYDVIWRPVATGGFTGDKTMPEWEIEFDDPSGDLEEEILVSARGQAPKRPSETRDIGVLKPGSLRFHRRIMWLLQKACKRIPGCPYGQSQDFIKKVVSRLGSRKDAFYMRDYTKSGMTIPHEVQAAVFNGFYRRRPELGIKAARFFKDQQLYFKDRDTGEWELRRPDTGSPLGLFVEGYTLLQYALHELNLREVTFPSSSCLFSATNDDMVAAFDSPLDAQEYLLADERNNALIGMQYKDTKSGIATHAFVFCEEYWLNECLQTKDSLFTTAIVGAWHAASPFMAKEYTYSILLSCGNVSDKIINALRDTQARVGYEFHEDEYHWPYLFGGWLPCIKEGLDHSITWYDGDLRAQAGYWASQMRINPKGSLSDRPTMALSRKMNMRLVAEPSSIPDWVDLVPLMGTKRTLKRHYRRAQTDYKSVFREYDKLAKLRLAKFHAIMEGKIDFDSPTYQWLRRHPKSVWLSSFPNMVTRDPIGRVPAPRYGFKDRSFDMKVLMLKQKGYVDAVTFGNRHVPKSYITLAEAGIIQPCQYEFLPISEDGISVEILKNHYPGFLPWYSVYGKVPVSLWEGDYPYECTKLWPYAYVSSLVALIRSWRYIVPLIDRPIDMTALLWIASTLDQIGALEAGSWDPDDEEDTPVETETSLAIGAMIRDVVRDWVPDADVIIDQMRSRLIPLPEDKRPKNYHELVEQHLVIDPFTLGRNPLLPGQLDMDADDDDQVYDPWSDLGV